MAGAVGSCRAVILCGGKGERLRPLTSEIPKPLICIRGRPILGYILDYLERSRIANVVVCTGYKSKKIEEYFEAASHMFNVSLVDSGDVDIIKRVQDAALHIDGDFLLLYGDTLSNVNLQDMIEFHRGKSEKATVTVWPLRSQFGLLDINENDRVTSFKEKPILDKWINIGYFYFNFEVLEWMRGFERFEDFLQYIVNRKELNAFKHTGVHITVNTLKELETAEDNIKYI